jgi:hypothetical protein
MPLFYPVTFVKGQSWSTLLNPTLNANNPNWAGVCVVDALPAISSLGSAYRLTLSPVTSGANLVLASCFIGMAGTAPSFDGNQVQVKFSGSNGVTLTAGGSAVVSDPIFPTVQFSTSGSLLVAYGITSGDILDNVALAGYTHYNKSGDAANAGTTAKAGYTTVATRGDVLTKLEVLS